MLYGHYNKEEDPTCNQKKGFDHTTESILVVTYTCM
jgi:hypothetical protein